jgi:adenylate cyclase
MTLPTARARPAVGEIDLSLPDRPSIAVLPFTNMSGDPEQEYFTDGITEDVITELSRFHSLFVIARKSSFSYKGKSPDIRQVGRELGVRYVLEGSIRKSAGRIRVTGQLVDALTGNHIWAEKYDRELEDIFALQEEVTRSIVMAIAPHIDDAEREKVHRRRPESLGAYERAVSAWAKASTAYIHSDAGLFNEALNEAQVALAIDARSCLALQVMAFVHWQRYILGTSPDRTAAWQAGISAAAQAIELDRNDSNSYALKAWILSTAPDAQRADEALLTAQRACELNPNSLYALSALAYCELSTGLLQLAIPHLQQVLRLNPRDPMRHTVLQQLTMACVLKGAYAEGVEYALLGLSDAPDVPQLHGFLAMSHVGLGDIAKAKDAFDSARRLGAAWVERGLAGGFVVRKPEHLHRATTLLRIAAGLEDPSAADVLR